MRLPQLCRETYVTGRLWVSIPFECRQQPSVWLSPCQCFDGPKRGFSCLQFACLASSPSHDSRPLAFIRGSCRSCLHPSRRGGGIRVHRGPSVVEEIFEFSLSFVSFGNGLFDPIFLKTGPLQYYAPGTVAGSRSSAILSRVCGAKTKTRRTVNID